MVFDVVGIEDGGNVLNGFQAWTAGLVVYDADTSGTIGEGDLVDTVNETSESHSAHVGNVDAGGDGLFQSEDGERSEFLVNLQELAHIFYYYLAIDELKTCLLYTSDAADE